ncbi:MAG TPA: hypothetical protein DEA97_14160, partial [Bacteroidales bacterium]|nr:hypothetical protein [Bacteroidales bacterium]
MEPITYTKQMKKNQAVSIYNLLLIFFLALLPGISISQVAPVIEPTGGFHIDGNLINNSPTNGVGDWTYGSGTNYVFNNSGVAANPVYSSFYIDPYDNSTDLAFQGSKFNDNPNTWIWSAGKPSGKTDINNAMFHLSNDLNNNTWLIVAGDRYTTTGTSYIDFEFSQNTISRNPAGGFISGGPHGGRTINDMVLSMEYSNGGSNATVHFYLWKLVGGTYKYVEQAVPSTVAFALTNTSNASVPFGAFGSNIYAPYQFVEAAINITSFFGYVEPCLGISVKTVMIKTKASDSETAALSDFVEPIQVQLNLGNATISYNTPFCNYGTAPVILAGVGGGSFSSAPAGLSINSVTGEIDLSSSLTGSYTVTYAYETNGCNKTTTTEVIVSPLPTAAESVSVDRSLVCADDNGNITLTATGGSGSSLVWYAGSCSGAVIGSGNSITIPSPNVTTTYYARWENLCGNSDCLSVTVDVSNLMTATASFENIDCFNGTTSITVNPTGGTAPYNYSLNGGPSQLSGVFSGVTSGNYSVNVTDANGCSVLTDAIVIENPSALIVSTSISSLVSCYNGNNGSVLVSASGGTGSYTFSMNGDTPQSSGLFENLIAGNYNFVVTDANGCQIASENITLSDPEKLNASITGSYQVSCYNSTDGEISVVATGGTGDYSFSLNGGALQNTGVFSGLPSGTYSVAVYDQNGCSLMTEPWTIINPSAITAFTTASAQVSCFDANDGMLSVTATGGTGSYFYSLNGGPAQASNKFYDLPAGTYEVLVTDENGCSVLTSAVSIANPERLEAYLYIVTGVDCFASKTGSLTIVASGGTGSYTYSLNGGAVQSSYLYTGLFSGTYVATVYDSNGCSVVTEPVTITDPPLLVASATGSSQVSCYNAADGEVVVSATGGTGDY